LLGLTLGLALLVWPTPYEYEEGEIDVGSAVGARVLPFRIRRSRITGLAEISVDGGPWGAPVGEQIQRALSAEAREGLLLGR
jgi:hypothetical protein